MEVFKAFIRFVLFWTIGVILITIYTKVTPNHSADWYDFLITCVFFGLCGAIGWFDFKESPDKEYARKQDKTQEEAD